MLHTRWSAEAWAEVRVEFKRALALTSPVSPEKMAKHPARCSPPKRARRATRRAFKPHGSSPPTR
jgi:hypothetical protein